MFISVIVPLYRGKKYISRIIRSIEANVKTEGWETQIIFVNDDPQDFFEEDCYTSQNRINIEFINHKQNKGIHQTKIDGFKKAKGQYLLFLDQDDTISDFYFTSQLKKIGKYDAVFCNGFRRQGESIYYPGKMETYKFHLDEYLMFGYPLISLGQMLVRHEAVPKGWIENPMGHNGWDDHLFWICMLYEQSAIQYNSEYLYVHEEAGENASFDWTAMKNSGTEFRDKVAGLNIFDTDDERRFTDTIEKRVAKYDKYIELDNILNRTGKQEVNAYLYTNSIQTVAVYGVGVYGKKLCQMLDPQKVCIKYGIDKNALHKHADFPIYENVREDIPVDCIICATGFEDEALKEKIRGNVLTMKEILRKAGSVAVGNYR